MRREILVFAVMILALACSSAAETWYITPDGTGDAPSIQAGIDSAAAGDLVLLADGVYTGTGNRDIVFYTKAVTVRSENGDPDLCIIDCQGSELDPHRGFGFGSGTSSASALEGSQFRMVIGRMVVGAV
ncbi:MAG: hypothetical protein ABIJ00_07815 [Candidatus Eisenbacteria bacterium]